MDRGWSEAGGRVGSERDEAPVWKVGGSGTGKKLGTKHDISLAESGHFLPRLFRRVLRLASRKKFRFSCAEVAHTHARARTYTILLVWLFRSRPGRRAIYLSD